MDDPTLGTLCEPRAGSAELALRRWGWTGDEITRLAGRAVRTQKTIPDSSIEDAVAHLVLIGCRLALIYDPDRDEGTRRNIPVKTRFGAFVYWRMQRRLIDWMRIEFGDPRPGRKRPDTPVDPLELWEERSPWTSNGHADDADLEDFVLSKAKVDRWRLAARTAGQSVQDWADEALEFYADMQASLAAAAA